VPGKFIGKCEAMLWETEPNSPTFGMELRATSKYLHIKVSTYAEGDWTVSLPLDSFISILQQHSKIKPQYPQK
jgi:hypothetical protein